MSKITQENCLKIHIHLYSIGSVKQQVVRIIDAQLSINGLYY